MFPNVSLDTQEAWSSDTRHTGRSTPIGRSNQYSTITQTKRLDTDTKRPRLSEMKPSERVRKFDYHNHQNRSELISHGLCVSRVLGERYLNMVLISRLQYSTVVRMLMVAPFQLMGICMMALSYPMVADGLSAR